METPKKKNTTNTLPPIPNAPRKSRGKETPVPKEIDSPLKCAPPPPPPSPSRETEKVSFRLKPRSSSSTPPNSSPVYLQKSVCSTLFIEEMDELELETRAENRKIVSKAKKELIEEEKNTTTTTTTTTIPLKKRNTAEYIFPDVPDDSK